MPAPRTIGRYTVQRVLGRGGMGTVYLATDPRIDREVAIKVLPAAGGDEYADRLLAEARVSGRLVHPHIVGVYDVGDEDGQLFVVMPYVNGRTLASVIMDAGRPPLAVKLEWMAQLCDGLAYAHERRVIHRDIKPSNLLIDERGALRILDFGIAKVLTTSQIQFTSVGTPAYMAPEQYSSAPVDPRTDLFSAGLVFYELLTHRRALGGTTPAQIYGQLMAGAMPRVLDAAPDVAPAVAAVCERAMSREPADRFQTARAFADALQAARTAPPPPAVESTAPTVIRPAAVLESTAKIARPAIAPAIAPEPCPEPEPESEPELEPELPPELESESDPEIDPEAVSESGPAGPDATSGEDAAAPHWGRILIAGFVLVGIIAGTMWATRRPVAQPPTGSPSSGQSDAVHYRHTPPLRRRAAPELHAFTGLNCKAPGSELTVVGDPPRVVHMTWSCKGDGSPDSSAYSLLRQSAPTPVTLYDYERVDLDHAPRYHASIQGDVVLAVDDTSWAFLRTSDGGVIRRTAPPGILLGLSDDGRIVLVDVDKHLALFDVASGSVRRIDVLFEGSSPNGYMSETGRFVAFAAPLPQEGTNPPSYAAYVYDERDGSLKTINANIGTPRTSLLPSLAIGTDGDWIAYSAFRPIDQSGGLSSASDRQYVYAYQVSTGRTHLVDSFPTQRSFLDAMTLPMSIIDGNLLVMWRDEGQSARTRDYVWMALPDGERTIRSLDKGANQPFAIRAAPRCLQWPDFSAWCVDP
jgi:serine/threonine protein kinase